MFKVMITLKNGDVKIGKSTAFESKFRSQNMDPGNGVRDKNKPKTGEVAKKSIPKPYVSNNKPIECPVILLSLSLVILRLMSLM